LDEENNNLGLTLLLSLDLAFSVIINNQLMRPPLREEEDGEEEARKPVTLSGQSRLVWSFGVMAANCTSLSVTLKRACGIISTTCFCHCCVAGLFHVGWLMLDDANTSFQSPCLL
jgi:hypothetical protein